MYWIYVIFLIVGVMIFQLGLAYFITMVVRALRSQLSGFLVFLYILFSSGTMVIGGLISVHYINALIDLS